MVNLTRIYTRTGDDGTTSLGDLSRVSKNDLRLEAYADTDEANSAIGVALALGDLVPDVVALLTRVQNELFDVGADLCTPVVENPEYPPLRVEQAYIDRLEGECDAYNALLPDLRSFVLPGGTPGSALLHVARTVCRRAERLIVELASHQGEHVSEGAVAYVNRLSDFFFVASRWANAKSGVGDVLWVPGKTRNT